MVEESCVEHGSQWAAIRSLAERIAQLERENRKLRKVNEVLKVASAFFRPRRSSTAAPSPDGLH